MSEFNFPTEEVELASKGLIYPKKNPLSSGVVEIKYMSAKEEDILSNTSFIQKGNVLDKLLESVIVNKEINIKDLIIGDKNSLLFAARLLGMGKDYKVTHKNKEHTIDLSKVDNKEIDEEIITSDNEFPFTLPHSKNSITFKLLNGHDIIKIDQEIRGLLKIDPELERTTSTKLKYTIISINGDSEKKTIREFVDKALISRDIRALKEYIEKIQPDVDLNYELEDKEEVRIPIGIRFFWPDV